MEPEKKFLPEAVNAIIKEELETQLEGRHFSCKILFVDLLWTSCTVSIRRSWSGTCVYFLKTMMTSSNGNIFRVTGHLCGEFTRTKASDAERWIPRTKASDALVFSLICAWINGWVNNRETGDLRRYCAHYNVTVMNAARKWFWCRRLYVIDIAIMVHGYMHPR